MPARVSLKEIAATVGLSVASVSEILNNRPNNYSSEATKERVRRVAKEMGYQVSFGYKLLRRQKTRTVAIMNSRAQMNDEEHIMALTLRLTTGFDRLGYAAYYNAFSDDAEANLKKVRELIGRGVESFVFLGQPFGQQEIMAELEASGVTVTIIALFAFLRGSDTLLQITDRRQLPADLREKAVQSGLSRVRRSDARIPGTERAGDHKTFHLSDGRH